jgi:O-antigen ligase
MRYEPKQQLRMFALVIGLGAIASLAAGIFFPGIGITADGSWQGVYFPKNSLGRIMSLGALCFALLALSQRRYRVVRGGMFFLCCLLLLLSKSATAVVVCFLMFALFPFRKTLYMRTRPLIGVMVAGGVVATAIVLWTVDHLDEILQTLGRTSSLTGRIPLWEIVIREIAERPLLGYGFSAFWTSWEGERVSDTVAWDVAVPNAHNGFLEVGLGLGLIGVAILAIGMGRNFLCAVRRARGHREMDQAWPLILLIFLALYNLTETSLLIGNSILWMAYVASSCWLVRSSAEEKMSSYRAEVPEPAYSA